MKLQRKISIFSYAAAAAASSGSKTSLEVKDITLDWGEVKNTVKLMLTRGNFVNLNTPQTATEDILRRTVLFLNLKNTTK